MSEIIGVITNVEDDSYQGKDFKKVTLGTGQVLKVKHGREGALKTKWGLLSTGTAMKFIMQDYTKPDGIKIPFVSDIETVGGVLPPPTTPTMLPAGQQVIDKALEETRPISQASTKDRAVAASYSKDLVIANKVNLGQMFEWADKFLHYITGVKDVKKAEELPDEKTEPRPARVDDRGGGVKTTKELMDWAIKHGKEYTPSWIRKEANLSPNAVITDAMAVEAYGKIKEITGWED